MVVVVVVVYGSRESWFDVETKSLQSISIVLAVNLFISTWLAAGQSTFSLTPGTIYDIFTLFSFYSFLLQRFRPVRESNVSIRFSIAITIRRL